MRRVDVGVVTWNTGELTATALRRLLDEDQGCDLRVLVHDNGSSDGTPETLKERVPEAEIEICEHNLGFARAMNRLMERSDGPWFFALNSDAWPEPGALGELVRTAEEHPRCAAVAPLILRPDGTLEHSTHPFPSIAVALLDLVGGRGWLPNKLLDRLCLEGAWSHDRPRTVDWAVGAALLMRRAALDELGGFSEQFFMYIEDLEWCWRATRGGWEIRLNPDAVVRHVGDVSGSRRFQGRRAALESANLDRFLRDTHRPAWVSAYRVFTALGAVSRMMASRLAGDLSKTTYWRGRVVANLGWAELPRLIPDPESRADDDDAASTEALGARQERESHVRVSVAVSTYRRPHLLPRLIAALEKQTLAPEAFEVIVVDNASPDDTSAVLETLANATTINLRHLRATEQRGPAGGRNLAWRTARAPIVAFTDDDCIPSPDWLECGLAAFDGRPQIVIGRTIPPADQLDEIKRAFARVLSVEQVRFFETCNIFYRRADLMEADGFDEGFRQPGGEDTDLALRLVEDGAEALFAPEALVEHDVRPGSWSAALREATRWTDIPLVLRRHPAARANLLHRWVFWKPSHPTAILAAVGLLAGTRWRPALALALPWCHYRVSIDPVAPGPRRRVAALPGALAIDLLEVAVMLRGSIRHRTVVL